MSRLYLVTIRAASVVVLATLLAAPVAAANPAPKQPPPKQSKHVFHCQRECGYPTGLYNVCRYGNGWVVSKTLVTLNACIR